MLSRLFQTTKAICCAVMLALLVQAGGLGCALGCARAASITNSQECHTAASNLAPATQTVSSTISSDHACCHRANDERREMPSAIPAETFHPVAGMMPCCVLAGQALIPSVKQSAATDKDSTLTQERVPVRLNVEFRVAPLTTQALFPDRGGTYLRCCVLLI
jgi:hypothetical protein